MDVKNHLERIYSTGMLETTLNANYFMGGIPATTLNDYSTGGMLQTI